MNATRSNINASHNQKANALIEALKSRGLKQVLFFWSPKEGGSQTDGADTNFPLLSALVELEGSSGASEYKVFDGSFLSVSGGGSGYYDVERVLDVAERLSNVSYGISVLPFTSHLKPEEAVTKMLDPKLILHPLTSTSRPHFFEVRKDLVTEQELANY